MCFILSIMSSLSYSQEIFELQKCGYYLSMQHKLCLDTNFIKAKNYN